MLKSAAHSAGKQYTAYYERDFSYDEEHDFSAGFEKRLKVRRRNAEHPTLSAAIRYAAVILLAAFLGFGAFSDVTAKPREALNEWISRNIGSYYVLDYDGTSSTDVDPVEYMLTFIPDGYTFYDYDDTAGVQFLYTDEDGRFLSLTYFYNPDMETIFIQDKGTEMRSATVNGIPATILISSDPAISSTVVWIDENDTLFVVDAFLAEEDLIKLAESVKPVE